MRIDSRGEMLSTHHHWLPVLLAILLPVTFIITYVIAVANDHVEPGFPYISDTGTHPPESCVFGQLLNIGAVICGVVMYIRYRHVEALYAAAPRLQSIRCLNIAAFITGVITNLGVSMVGNFQETSVIVVHLIGAFFAFGVGFVYCLLQTIISFRMKDELPGNSICIRRFRAVLCIIQVVLLIILIVAALVAGSKGPGPGVQIYNWTASHPGYAEHLVSTISEWLIAIMDVIFFATFYQEFKHFRVHPPKVEFYSSDTHKESMPDLTSRTDTENLAT